MIIKSYNDLISLKSFEERFEYLKINNVIGEETFGFSRYINQRLYHSIEWRNFRDKIIVRDNGCDLGIKGYEIIGPIIIHHINPITYNDIVNMNDCVFDFNNVITTKLSTHNAIHYSSNDFMVKPLPERQKNDTCPWHK